MTDVLEYRGGAVALMRELMSLTSGELIWPTILPASTGFRLCAQRSSP
jgi:hypothetical protein